MCYYARTDFACGDWRWGNMKQRCPRQPRIGETCGAKLVDTENLSKSDEDCKNCQEMAVKKRRLQKEKDNLTRWRTEGDRFTASIAKAEDEVARLQKQIDELNARRPSMMFRARANWGVENLARRPQ
ncbi:hypothetical protein AYO21_10569 [Fonsecaea monophora]|uniref:Uncharacterized protein n=2 Tax=Fonsecaea TaxID=40354 RepID=A0A0D2GDJ3_9EURO|nr:uncharacterized protein Z517_08662 [Fonsecaea pedrosoi CBS 271.37]XP_022507185.1 hypothetical protein AYO21_10569 [Fonsecaea monophora]KAH0843567.1 hypothetical protein FOPE_09157 [Fonsecaea pedrosoi]KIW78823.1 hypothetical protein Z517_08662 [Fonsecaea pedrosoi CBS 271.37]OAG35233.1 hypothetical protein AYO21_10569 [Fonsecaea monophora]